jgi:hypothetical protein
VLAWAWHHPNRMTEPENLGEGAQCRGGSRNTCVTSEVSCFTCWVSSCTWSTERYVSEQKELPGADGPATLDCEV